MGLEEAGEVAAVVDAYAAADEGDACAGLFEKHFFGFLNAERSAPGAEIHAKFLEAVLVELGRRDAHLLGATGRMGIVKEILA